MNRLLLPTALVAACFALSARAQITITQADVEAVFTGGTNTQFGTESSAGLLALAAQTGANQTWDFTGLAYEAGLVNTATPVEPPVPGSGDPHLAQATHILRIVSADSTAYVYEQLDAGSWTRLGVANEQFLVRFVPGQTILELPCTFGTAWTSSYEFLPEPPFPVGELTVDESSSVVGWGTLVTPAGSTSALMIRTEITNRFVFDPFPPVVTRSTQVQFTSYDELSAYIFIPETGPAIGNYNVYDQTVAVEPPAGTVPVAQLDAVAPNPLRAGDAVPLTFSLPAPVTVRLEVFNVLGRRVAVVLDGAPRPAGRQHATWATRGLAPGVYTVRLTAGGQSATSRANVVH